MSCLWEAYAACFRLLSPLHIGWRRVGNLQQTRRYLPARNLWGALTARLARLAGVSSSDQAGYKQVGESVEHNLRFSYFFPISLPAGKTFPDLDANSRLSPWPWGDEEKFSWLFLSSQASTAINAAGTAEEGSLHDAEFIAPFTRENEPVGLFGYVFVRKNALPDWQVAWHQGLQFGGERTYGWGRVQARDPELLPVAQSGRVRCFGYEVDLTVPEAPIFVLAAETHLLAHSRAQGLGCTGAVESLMVRETREGHFFGRYTKVLDVCWTPGSKLLQPARLAIDGQGIWYPAAG